MCNPRELGVFDNSGNKNIHFKHHMLLSLPGQGLFSTSPGVVKHTVHHQKHIYISHIYMCVFTHVGANGSLLNKCTQKGSQKGSSPDLCSTSGKYKRQIEDGKTSWFSCLEMIDSEVSISKCD